MAWIEGNRRKVDEATGGKVAYVYMPDTSFGGLTNFTRYYYAQVGKEAVIIDERFNGGGALATDRAIKRRLLREMLSHALGRSRSSGPRASRSLMIPSERDARGPEENEVPFYSVSPPLTWIVWPVT